MGVLQERCKYNGEINGSLTTRFVYDWRLKRFENGSNENGIPIKKWMRRSRYVAREFANSKPDDVYSPATGSHTANLIPILFLQKLQQLQSNLNGGDYDVILTSLDIKDAFLQVLQQHVVSVTLHETEYICGASKFAGPKVGWVLEPGIGSSGSMSAKVWVSNGAQFNHAWQSLVKRFHGTCR